jgi:hypothetical protein
MRSARQRPLAIKPSAPEPDAQEDRSRALRSLRRARGCERRERERATARTPLVIAR